MRNRGCLITCKICGSARHANDPCPWCVIGRRAPAAARVGCAKCYARHDQVKRWAAWAQSAWRYISKAAPDGNAVEELGARLDELESEGES
jgi:hypothetical protein